MQTIQTFRATYSIGKLQSLHKIVTQFNVEEIKKFGLKNVIRHNAEHLGVIHPYHCHVDFDGNEEVIAKGNGITDNRNNQIKLAETKLALMGYKK
jgi:hypothetical protein